MKTSVTRIALEKILELGEITLDAFFPQQYSYTRISRRLLGLDSYPSVSPRTFSVILSRLKQQGLIAVNRRGKKSFWSITNKGKKYVNDTRPSSQPPKDGIMRLVIFDIPEKERRKRNTIRAELVALDFKKLQKSVWVGFNPLTKDFIDTLDALLLRDKVHLFTVNQRGTMDSV